MGKFIVAGKAKTRGVDRIDPRLVAIVQRAAERSPYDVQLFSGKRFGNATGSRHNTGNAVDIVLVDPNTGQEIPNLKSSVGYPIYQDFARLAKEVQQAEYPELSNAFRWGGGFSGDAGKYGAVDMMHFDLKPGGSMLGFKGRNLNEQWQMEFTPNQARIVADMGPGFIYSADGQKRAPGNVQYADLTGRARDLGSPGIAAAFTTNAIPAYAETPQGSLAGQAIEDYIRDAAVKRGIDPDIATRVYEAEGKLGTGANLASTVDVENGQPYSYGPFQLNVKNGIGKDFIRDTGLDPSDPSTIPQQIDWTLDHVAENGWSPFHGWKGSARAGLENARPAGIQTAELTGGILPARGMTPTDPQPLAPEQVEAVRVAQEEGIPLGRAVSDTGWRTPEGLAGMTKYKSDDALSGPASRFLGFDSILPADVAGRLDGNVVDEPIMVADAPPVTGGGMSEMLAGGNVPTPRTRPTLNDMTRRGQPGGRRTLAGGVMPLPRPAPDRLVDMPSPPMRPNDGSMVRPNDYITGLLSGASPDAMNAGNYAARPLYQGDQITAAGDMPVPPSRPAGYRPEVGIPLPRDNPRRDPAGFPIDVYRPRIDNGDGTFSTERTTTFDAGELGRSDGIVTIPTIVDGYDVGEAGARLLYSLGKNPPVQSGFTSFEEADRAAQARSTAIAAARETALGDPRAPADVNPMQRLRPVEPPTSPSLVRGPPDRPIGALPAATPERMSDAEYQAMKDEIAALRTKYAETPEQAYDRMTREREQMFADMDARAGQPIQRPSYAPDFSMASPATPAEQLIRPPTQGAMFDPSMAMPQMPPPEIRRDRLFGAQGVNGLAGGNARVVGGSVPPYADKNAPLPNLGLTNPVPAAPNTGPFSDGPYPSPYIAPPPPAQTAVPLPAAAGEPMVLNPTTVQAPAPTGATVAGTPVPTVPTVPVAPPPPPPVVQPQITPSQAAAARSQAAQTALSNVVRSAPQGSIASLAMRFAPSLAQAFGMGNRASPGQMSNGASMSAAANAGMTNVAAAGKSGGSPGRDGTPSPKYSYVRGTDDRGHEVTTYTNQGTGRTITYRANSFDQPGYSVGYS